MTTVLTDHASVQKYLKQVSAGLKGIDEAQKQEILAEIGGHLSERGTELRAQGATDPIEQAISSLGDPNVLASAFIAEARAKRGIRSYSPWMLLHRASRVARTGSKGCLVFLIGLFGYGFALAAVVAMMLKPFIPEMGLWVGSFGAVVGVKSDGAQGHELLGHYFIYAMVALAFVFASSTTLLLRRLTRKVPFWGKWPTRPSAQNMSAMTSAIV